MPIVNFVSHVIQSGSDPDGFVKWVRPGQNMTRMTRPSFNAGMYHDTTVVLIIAASVFVDKFPITQTTVLHLSSHPQSQEKAYV